MKITLTWYGTLFAESSPELGVTVLDPAASRIAALVIGASFDDVEDELVFDELDEVSLPDELDEEEGLKDEVEGLDDEEEEEGFPDFSASALAFARSFSFSRSFIACILACFSASSLEEGFDDEPEEDEEVDVLDELEVEEGEDEDLEAATCSGGVFIS